jgi:hypothetical protein
LLLVQGWLIVAVLVIGWGLRGGGEPISGFGGGYTCMCMRGCVEHHILVFGGLGG